MRKAPEAFRTISEAADALDTPAHVLRFWESKFTAVKPVKRAGGRRYYRPADIDLLSGIKLLLHDQGMTIRAVQKLLQDKGARHVAALAPVSAEVLDMGAKAAAAEPASPADAGEERAAPTDTVIADTSTPRDAPAAPDPVQAAADPDATPQPDGGERTDPDAPATAPEAPAGHALHGRSFTKLAQALRATPPDAARVARHADAVTRLAALHARLAAADG